MAEGVDSSWDKPTVDALKSAGKSFYMGYLPYPGSGGKEMSAQNVKDYANGGIENGVFFERYARRAAEGRAAGQEDGRLAAQGLAAIGLPSGMPVYYAVDWDATPGDQAAIDEYLRGAAEVRSLDTTGIYGGFYPVMRADQNGTAKWFCQTYAWSGGQVYARAHLYQYLNGQKVGGAAVDFERSLQEVWGQASKFGGITPNPSPSPSPSPAPSGSYTVTKTIPGYVTAADAAAHKNSNSTVPAGTYSVFNTSNGMVNITRQAGSPGWWINPSDNSAPAPAPAPAPSGSYTVTKPIPGYVNAGDAANRRNSNSTVPAGTYSVFNTAQGMVNVTRTAGQPGWWINPGDNGGSAPAPSGGNTDNGSSFTVNHSVPGYVTAADAMAGRNSNSTVPTGTYAVFNRSNGAVNITRQAGQPGWWINPNA